MRVQIKNLGVIKEADFEVGDLTIICGDNNTGKTYVNYALYGFFDYWRNAFDGMPKAMKALPDIEEEGEGYAKKWLLCVLQEKDRLLRSASKSYCKKLPTTFASSKDLYELTHFSVSFADELKDDVFEVHALKKNLQAVGEASRLLGSVIDEIKNARKTGSDFDYIHSDKAGLNAEITQRNLIFSLIMPYPFCLCTERAGIMALWSEYDAPADPWNTGSSRKKSVSSVPLPVQRNLDFLRNIKNGRYKEPGELAQQHPDILEQSKEIVGGDFKVLESIPFFVPNEKTSAQLQMNESSGSVRSLFLLSNYLYYMAEPGDILMIDEPELNLHPEKQRLMARLLTRLVNAGIKVFLTTHSDYLIRELNILIMLHQKEPRFKKIMKEEKYRENELLDVEKVRVYTAEKMKKGKGYTLCQAHVDPKLGIEVKTFDQTINRTNAILEEIVYGQENVR